MSLLVSAQHPMAAVLPNTEYFEIDSAVAGVRYAIWVTTPPLYAGEPDRHFPAVFVTDGNMRVLKAPGNYLLFIDPIHPIQPFIQVSIGYCGDEAADLMRVRNRDLLPPGEPAPQVFLTGIDEFVAKGAMTSAEGEAYKASLAQGRADLFLRFMAEELHPAVTARWRIDVATSSLYGYSYGGLFAAWVAMQRHPLFTRIGAGSAGMTTPQSKVFELLANELSAGADHSGRRLHMTVCEREITATSFYQLLGNSFAQFVTTLGATPLKGLTFTTHIVPYESHFTGDANSWFSFLRACYSAR
jgi:uncharacterized protein